jgi:transcriptional regulator with XRE-family HTH domain
MGRPEGSLSAALARNVHALRSERGWSLDVLAQRSGVSKGMLVQIEKGSSNPSIGTLNRISEAFGVTVVQLIEVAEAPALRLVRPDEAVTLWRGDSGSHADLLLGLDLHDHVELWSWELGPGAAYRTRGHLPGTREMIQVAQGRLELEVGGETVRLDTGDSLLFGADRDHRYLNPGRTPARFAMIVVMPERPAD